MGSETIIRAKTEIKLQTPNVNMDYGYVKGTKLSGVIRDLMDMVLLTDEADEFKASVLKKFEEKN